MSLEIRRAEPKDAEAVALLGRITFAETFGSLFQNHADDLRSYLDHTFNVANIRRSLVEPDNRYWLALVDELPVSYAKLKFPSPVGPLGGAEVAQLQKIYVLREFVGHGIGKRMLHAVIDDARSLRIARVWLDVLKENARAIRFYERERFRPLGEDRYTIGAQTFAFHLMVRNLEPE
jgi:ribosomal protein S18 acetylase RimI-like enzyme